MTGLNSQRNHKTTVRVAGERQPANSHGLTLSLTQSV